MDIPRPLNIGRMDIDMRYTHWRLNRDPPRHMNDNWKEHMYVVGEYTVSSYRMDETEGTWRVIVWGTSKFRGVDVIVHPDKTSVLNLNYDTYDKDGMKHMVNFTLEFLKSLNVESVHVNAPLFKVNCNGNRIPLELMHLLKYGDTWYEKTFGFVPSSRYAEEVRAMKESRTRLPALQDIPCEEFTDKFAYEMLGKLDEAIVFSYVEWVKYL